MSSAASSSRLRLVGSDDPAAREVWARERGERATVIRENRAAAQNKAMQPTDARWVLAARTASLLQGPVLTPDRRKKVLRTAQTLGVRAFDANVIIAVVQDGARRGEPLAATAPTLQMVPEPSRRRGWSPGWRLAAAAGAAIALNALIIRWLVG